MLEANFVTRVFLPFYMLAYLLDSTEDWDVPHLSGMFLIIAFFSYRRLGVSLNNFLMFISLALFDNVLNVFPNNSNHGNVILFLNVAMLAASAWVYLKRSANPIDEWWHIIRQVAARSLAVVYFFAGFHKLNPDFFHPVHGCSSDFLQRVTGIVPGLTINWPEWVILTMGVVVVAWELGAGIALCFRKTQKWALLVSFLMHIPLALSSFFDFASLAYCIYLAYLPSGLRQVLLHPLRFGKFTLTRIELFFLMVFAGMAWSFIDRFVTRLPVNGDYMQGVTFTIGALYLYGVICRQGFKGYTGNWLGWDLKGFNRAWWLLPASLCFFALNPYLGLRTAGVFSMFSNLQTEGTTSNHFILKNNPLKIWDYQEQQVEVLDLHPYLVQGRTAKLVGTSLPLIEWRKRLKEWQLDLPGQYIATVRFQGHEYRVSNNGTPMPTAFLGPPRWEERFLNFRPIITQENLKKCQW